MKFRIRHETKGRIRVHMEQKRMTCHQADVLAYYLSQCPLVDTAKVYERTADAVLCYHGSREAVIGLLKAFHYENAQGYPMLQ